MNSRDDAAYRLRLAKGFLSEAEQDVDLHRWRSCVDNAQLAVENAGKTVLSIFGPLDKTHDPAHGLRMLIEKKSIHRDFAAEMDAIVPVMEELGSEEHFLTDYGDEESYRDPWALFGEKEAWEALASARQCVHFASRVFDFYTESGRTK